MSAIPPPGPPQLPEPPPDPFAGAPRLPVQIPVMPYPQMMEILAGQGPRGEQSAFVSFYGPGYAFVVMFDRAGAERFADQLRGVFSGIEVVRDLPPTVPPGMNGHTSGGA